LGGLIFIGRSPEMENPYGSIARISRSTHSVLIEGETGTERNWWHAPSTFQAIGGTGRSLLWIVAQSRRRCSKASYLVMFAGLSQER
jgi:hypothetical protein